MQNRAAGILVLMLLVFAGPGLAQTRIVTGKVTDSLTGDLVTSGQVSVQGTTTGTTIKDDGTFTLAAPARDLTLSIRSIGFKRHDVAVTTGQSSVTVALARDYFQLEAIVVTGQATGVERKNLANAVATVTAADISRVPSGSIEQSLQGKLSGANIIKSSGAPGGGAVITMRGVSSIIGAFTPLYVIDGVVASDVAIQPGTNYVTQAASGFTVKSQGENAVNRIADLNPGDIENVEVLKGAAASAIYGSKASNGVILITTKRGRSGARQVTLTQRLGTQAVSKLVGSRTYQSMAEAVAVYGAKAQDPVTGWAAGKVFDNERELVGNKPLSYETAATLSGGTENTRYYASTLLKHDGGIATSTYYDKRSFRLNLDQDFSRRFSVSMSSELINSAGDRGLFNNENNGASMYAGLAQSPSFFDMRRNADGTWPVNPYLDNNVLQTAALFQNRENVWRLIGTGKMTLDAISSAQHTLRFIASGGTDFFNQHNKVFAPPELQFEPTDGLPGTSVASHSTNLNTNINGNVVYTFKARGGTSATTQFGVQYETRELEADRILATNLVGGIQMVTSGTTIVIDADHNFTKDFGFFAQEEFLTLSDKLLLTAGLRADQSSNNGDPDQLFYYPKASVSYRFPGLAPGFVDELKLRAAFGQSGNQPLYRQKFTELGAINFGGLAGAQIQNTAANVNIKPERQREFEGGVDATLFKGRANLEVTAYEKRITDLLLSQALPTSTGFTKVNINGGVLRTRGVELSLGGLPIQSRSFQWSVRSNFFAARGKMVSLPVPRFGGGGGFGNGTVRIEQDSSVTQIIGTDSLPNGTTFETKVGEAAPDYTIQLGNDFTFKGLKLYMLWDRSKGGRMANLTQWLYDLYGNSADYDVPTSDGRKLGLVRALQARKVSRVYNQDISFLKLREVTLSIDVPQSIVRKVWSGSRYVRMSLSGRNLLTFTPYAGTDPEQRWRPDLGAAASAPQELWAYPPSRSFWFSVDLGL